MPRFKPVDYSPRFLAVDLARQLIAGTFEYALHHLLEHEINLSAIEARYDNDELGASAYDPRVLLKIVLLAYSRGIVSSRGMEAACRDNVLFMAISGDSAPHYSTLASFVSSLGQALSKVFAQVLTICERRGLIGREMFAIDGVKLPSNASKAKSGKRKDFLRQVAKMEKAVEQMLAKHRDNDAAATDPALQPREQRHIERLQAEAQKMRDWLKQHPQERKSAKGKERLSNRTDNESAKMPTDKGVVQGYTGVAAVDEKHQIILEAQAHGSGSEQELLMPVTAAIAPMAGEHTVVCTDSGYHSQANLEQLEAQGIEAFIADHNYRVVATRATRDRRSTPPSPRRCGTRARSRRAKRNCSSRATLRWQPTTPIASVRRASGCIAAGLTATLVGARRSSSRAPSATAEIARKGPSVYAILSAPTSDR